MNFLNQLEVYANQYLAYVRNSDFLILVSGIICAVFAFLFFVWLLLFVIIILGDLLDM